VDQQGSPPGRSAQGPGSGRSGRDDETGRDWRAARQQGRLQRRERAASWRDDEAFAPPADDQLPPWAGPDVYPQRPAGTQRRDPPGTGHQAGYVADPRPSGHQPGSRPGDYQPGPGPDTYQPGPAPGDYQPSQGRHGAPARADYQQQGDYQPHDYPAGGAAATTAGYRPSHGQHAEADYQDQDSHLAREAYEAEPGLTAAGRVPAQAEYGYADDADTGSGLATGVQQGGPDDEDVPPAGRRRGRRAAAARLRRSRRRVYTYCGTAIVIVVLIAAGVWVHGLMHHSKPGDGLVTSLQPGEYSAVPSSCGAVSTALLNQYLAPSGRSITKPLTSSTDSECTFTVDSTPVFRVLDVTVQAFQPSALASGNGNATQNAIGNYDVALQNLVHPVKNSGQPAATISTLKGVGQRGFSALRVVRGSKIVTDLVTVSVQLHNVLITITLQGQESGDGFGPVSISDLQAGALAAARQVLAKVQAEPTVH
jgi:hypothetical protein